MPSYHIAWREFWWDETRECGYLHDFHSADFEAASENDAHMIWANGEVDEYGTVRSENGALEMDGDEARWEQARPVFIFDIRAVSEGIEIVIPIDESNESHTRNIIDFYESLYSGNLKAFGYGEGQSAVEEYIRANHPEIEWHYCLLCDKKEPTYGPACLVCGNMVNLAITNE